MLEMRRAQPEPGPDTARARAVKFNLGFGPGRAWAHVKNFMY